MPADAPDPTGLTELERRLMLAEHAVRHWRVEATMRATAVAGTLTMKLLAAQKLAASAERLLTIPIARRPEFDDLRQTLLLYRQAQS